MIFPPVVRFRIPDANDLVLWHDHLIFQLRCPLIAAGFALSCLVLLLHSRKPGGSDANQSSRAERIGRALSGLGVIPVFAALMLMGDFLPFDVVSNLILLCPVLVISLILSAVLRDFIESGERQSNTREWTLHIFIVSVLVYASVGCLLAFVTGEHVGDEGHYLTQAKSLYLDHDLDIQNNLMEKKGEYAHDYDYSKNHLKEMARLKLSEINEFLHHIHVSVRSRNGHWYTHHPYGLPVLLAPFWPLGMIVRYILLGIISALGNVAMYKTARGLGAGRGASVVAVAGLGMSLYWTVYSARVLPEVLGAVLLMWAFWAMLEQDRRPWLTAVAGALCCGYLPMVHDRFLPLSLMAFGFYGLFGLCSSMETWNAKVKRLAVFTLLTGLGIGVYIWSQFHMFEGGMKYGIGGVIMSYPLGMWGAIADWRGVTPVLPLFVWFAGALLVCALGRSLPIRSRLFLCAGAVTFVVCLVMSCSNGIYVGGKCVPGRYILVAVPLLVPPAAYALERTGPQARWWFLFLGAMSLVLLIILLVFLPVLGRGFIFPVTGLSGCHPALAALFNPHASFLYPYRWLIGHTSTTVLVASGILLTALTILLSRRWRIVAVGLIAIVIALGVWAHVAQKHPVNQQVGEDMLIAKYLGRIPLGRVVIPDPVVPSTNLLDISRLTFRDFKFAKTDVGVTTADLGKRMDNRMVSQPRLESNDWANRGYAWTTLTAPYKPPSGGQILHLGGKLEGTAKLILALRQGSRSIFEGPVATGDDGVIRSDHEFTCRPFGGDLYILVRLADGEGKFIMNELYWTPYSKSLTGNTGLLPPAGLLSHE